MDPLKDTLIQRQMAPQVNAAPAWPAPAAPKPPGNIPTNPPPMPKTPAPPPGAGAQREQRYDTAQQMQDAYRNNWTPNPTLIRLTGGR